jgi:hypothetical protein
MRSAGRRRAIPVLDRDTELRLRLSALRRPGCFRVGFRQTSTRPRGFALWTAAALVLFILVKGSIGDDAM